MSVYWSHSLVRVARSSLGHIGRQGAAVVAQLALPPIFISQWGLSRYGQWLVLAAIPAFLTWAHLGFATAGGNRMMMSAAAGDGPGIWRAWQSARLGVGLVCGGLFAAALVAAVTVPWQAWLGLSLWTEREVRWAVMFLATGAVAQLTVGLSLACYRVALRDARGVWLVSATGLFQAGVVGTVVLWSQSAALLAAAWAGAQVASAAWLWYDAQRQFSPQRPDPGAELKTDLKEAAKEGAAQMLFPIGNALYFQGATLVVNHTLGSAAAAVFATLRTLSRVLAQTASVAKLASAPELSHLCGREDWAGMKRLSRLGFQVTLIVTGVLGIVLVAAGPWFVDWWTQGRLPVARVLLALFVAAAWFNALGAFGLGLAQATNRPWRAGLAQAAISAASLGAMGWLAGRWSLHGAAAAMIAAEVAIAIAGWWAALGLMRDGWPGFLEATIRFRELRQETGLLQDGLKQWRANRRH